MSKPTKITKEIILEKALEIIRTQGIEKVSNREIAKKLNWDYKAVARAGMLHDLFLYNWRVKEERKGLHAFTHAKQAYKNAIELFDLTDKEQNMIKTHMFPITIIPPKSKEGFLLTIIDKYCVLYEYAKYLSEKAMYKHVIKI